MCVAGSPAAAQDDAPGLITKSFKVEVKHDSFLQFEDAYRQHLQWHQKNEDSWGWHTWQIVNGEDLGQYLILSHGHRWQDFDADSAMRRSEWADFSTHIAPHLAAMSSKLESFEPAISNWPEGGDRPGLVELARFELTYEGFRNFRQAITKIHNAVVVKDPDRHFAWFTTVNGSNGPEMTLAIPHADWASFRPDETPLWTLIAEVHGQDEATALQKNIGESVRSQTTFVVEYRADLSYQPAQ
jgi:hypothetical protein